MRPDDVQAGLEATRHLISLGHRRIAWPRTVGEGHYSVQDREAGYRQAMADAGYTPRAYVAGKRSMESTQRYSMMLDLLRQDDRPAAFILMSGSDLMTLIRAAASIGVSIPQDLSVVYIGGRANSEAGMRATIFVLGENHVGERSVAELIKKIANPERKLEPLVVPGHLEIGLTTAPSQAN